MVYYQRGPKPGTKVSSSDLITESCKNCLEKQRTKPGHNLGNLKFLQTSDLQTFSWNLVFWKEGFMKAFIWAFHMSLHIEQLKQKLTFGTFKNLKQESKTINYWFEQENKETRFKRVHWPSWSVGLLASPFRLVWLHQREWSPVIISINSKSANLINKFGW